MSALEIAHTAARKFGTVQITGVYGMRYNMFPLGRFFERNITLKMGQAPVVHYMPKLFDMIANGQFDPTDMILSPIDCHLGKQQMVTISLPIEKITASRLY